MKTQHFISAKGDTETPSAGIHGSRFAGKTVSRDTVFNRRYVYYEATGVQQVDVVPFASHGRMAARIPSIVFVGDPTQGADGRDSMRSAYCGAIRQANHPRITRMAGPSSWWMGSCNALIASSSTVRRSRVAAIRRRKSH